MPTRQDPCRVPSLLSVPLLTPSQCKPVYLGFPTDLFHVKVSSEGLKTPLVRPASMRINSVQRLCSPTRTRPRPCLLPRKTRSRVTPSSPMSSTRSPLASSKRRSRLRSLTSVPIDSDAGPGCGSWSRRPASGSSRVGPLSVLRCYNNANVVQLPWESTYRLSLLHIPL